MKEFVEKLIALLNDEKHDYVMRWKWKGENEEDWLCMKAIEKVIGIVERIAEEHDNGFCEWEDTESLREKGLCYGSDGLYKPSCNDDEDDFMDWNWIRHFEFCPYCGKKIKVVE